MRSILKLVILGISILNFRTAQAQTLTSWMTGRTAQGNILSLKYAGPASWLLKDYTPCTKFPCRDKDQTKETALTARWNSSPTAADGNTEIGLSNGMIVTFNNNGMVPPNPNGTRVESYWQLEIPSFDGSPSEVVRLAFRPSIE